MKVNSYRDRSDWPAGPWDDEPEDYVQWTDQATGLPCLLHRGPHSAWCGYVAVPEGHSLFGHDYEDVPDEAWQAAHGGLTYADGCDDNAPEGEGICHVPEPGQSDNVWWFGFDAAHAGDRTPDARMLAFDGDVYRDRHYMAGRCRELAAALAERGQEQPR